MTAERIEVMFAYADDTHGIHRYTAPHASTQVWDGGRTVITLRDEDGRQIGSALYSQAVCIRRGAACDSGDAL